MAKISNVEDEGYVSVLDLIPLVKNLPKKSLSLCLASNFDDNLHTINKSANVSEFLSKTFDPIIKIICNNNAKTLASMSVEYKQSLQMESLTKYRKNGYIVYDFSNCKVTSPKIKISMRESWPLFYEALLKEERNKTHKVSWIKEDDDDDDDDKESTKRNIFLRFSFLNGSSSSSSFFFHPEVILPATSNPFGTTSRRFKDMDELEKMLRMLDGGHILIKKLYLTLDRPITTGIIDIMKLFCFIYGKKLSHYEVEALYSSSSSSSSSKYLIVLPFIAVKCTRGGEEGGGGGGNIIELCYY